MKLKQKISLQTNRHEARISAAGSTKLEEGLLRNCGRSQDNQEQYNTDENSRQGRGEDRGRWGE